MYLWGHTTVGITATVARCSGQIFGDSVARCLKTLGFMCLELRTHRSSAEMRKYCIRYSVYKYGSYLLLIIKQSTPFYAAHTITYFSIFPTTTLSLIMQWNNQRSRVAEHMVKAVASHVARSSRTLAMEILCFL
jgi:hypothetical protein